MITLYGIKNCDTVKKARRWLEQQQIDYQFHDYKSEGVDIELARQWLNEFGIETVINKRGTTWRKLDQQSKQNLDTEAALKLMMENSSIIKRPLIDDGEQRLFGFSEQKYQDFFRL